MITFLKNLFRRKEKPAPEPSPFFVTARDLVNASPLETFNSDWGFVNIEDFGIKKEGDWVTARRYKTSIFTIVLSSFKYEAYLLVNKGSSKEFMSETERAELFKLFLARKVAATETELLNLIKQHDISKIGRLGE